MGMSSPGFRLMVKSKQIYAVKSTLSCQENDMSAPEFPNPEDGRLVLMASLWDQNRPINAESDALTGPHRTAPTGGGASAALPLPVPPPKAVSLKECLIPAHEHGPLVTLHSVEWRGAELGLLARATPEEMQALADTACGLADVPAHAGSDLVVEYSSPLIRQRVRERGDSDADVQPMAMQPT